MPQGKVPYKFRGAQTQASEFIGAENVKRNPHLAYVEPFLDSLENTKKTGYIVDVFVGVYMTEGDAGRQGTLDLRTPLGENALPNLGGQWKVFEFSREVTLFIQQWAESGVGGERRKLRAIQMYADGAVRILADSPQSILCLGSVHHQSGGGDAPLLHEIKNAVVDFLASS